MTPETFRAIRIAAGMSVRELAAWLRIEDPRTIRRWEDGERPVSGPVSLLMEQLGSTAAAANRPPD